MVDFTDEDLSGSHFLRVNLSGARLHSPMMQGVRITDAWMDDVAISAFIRKLVVNEVDVTDYVRDELDRRYPERVQLRAGDADGLRQAWSLIEANAAATLDRALALGEASMNESVAGEFSFLETLRHLVFATDRWITGPVLAEPEPYHRLGIPPGDPAEGRLLFGLDVDARPSVEEVLGVRRQRMARVAELLRTVTDDELAGPIESPNGGRTHVRGCIHVVLHEEWEHNRYATRDLAVLEGLED